MNLNKFEAKVNLPQGVKSPDVYDSAAGDRPAGSFVISRRRDNSIASVYSDSFWDISPWQPEGRREILYFNFWPELEGSKHRSTLLEEARWLIFTLIWLKSGSPLSNGSIMNYMFLIRALAFYADAHSTNIYKTLSDEAHLSQFSEFCCKGGRLKTLSSLLSNLGLVEEKLLGFSIVGEKFRRSLRARVRSIQVKRKQTPPIPSAIYSEILSILASELTAWQSVEQESLNILARCGHDGLYGRRESAQKRTRKLGGTDEVRFLSWSNVSSSALRDYLSNRGQSDDVSGLVSAVTQVQLVAKLCVQAFTGMRDDEAFSLLYDCASTAVNDGQTHRLVHGRTTKLTKSPQRVTWVTSLEGHRAIEIAKRIAATIYGFCEAGCPNDQVFDSKWAKRPLFVSTAYLPIGGRRRATPLDGVYFAGCLSLARFHRMRARLQPLIKEEDIEELELIDEHRAWRSEHAFQVGLPWALETHQLRRSLALYAQSSGIVTLPSLRRQLQHITDEMTRYYARGSLYAKHVFNLSDSASKHFGYEWQSTQVESESISYLVNVLLTDQKLFGGHAAFVSHRLKDSMGNISSDTREETIKMFKNGQLRYRETIIGGCTRADECESSAIDWLSVDCISNNCTNMVGNINKLEAIIAEQERFVCSISKTTLLYRTEEKNLRKLCSARDQFRAGVNRGFDGISSDA